MLSFLSRNETTSSPIKNEYETPISNIKWYKKNDWKPLVFKVHRSITKDRI